MPAVRERPVYEGPVDEGSRRLGLVVVAVLTIVIGLFMVIMAFSTVNTPMSVDGGENTESQWMDSDE